MGQPFPYTRTAILHHEAHTSTDANEFLTDWVNIDKCLSIAWFIDVGGGVNLTQRKLYIASELDGNGYVAGTAAALGLIAGSAYYLDLGATHAANENLANEFRVLVAKSVRWGLWATGAGCIATIETMGMFK